MCCIYHKLYLFRKWKKKKKTSIPDSTDVCKNIRILFLTATC